MAEPATPDQLASGGADAGDAGGADPSAEPAAEPDAPGSSRPSGIIGVLLHTEPALSVTDTERELGVSTAAAHMVVAGRKALDAIMDGTTGSGTTVIEHVVAGTVEAVTNGRTDDAGDDSDGDAPLPVEGEPA